MVIWLLRFVKSERGLQKQTVATLVAISTIFVISFTPYAVMAIFEKLITPESYVYYRRFAGTMLQLNIATNPIIYYVTVRSFRNFVNQMIPGPITRQNAVEPISTQITADN